MQLILQTWNSLDIQGSVYESWIPPGQLVNLQARGISVPRADAFPFLSTTAFVDHFFTFMVKILPNGSIPEYREQLKGWFNITDRQRHNLVAKDVLDADRLWYLTGFPVRLIENSAGIYTITIQTEMPIWRVVTAIEDTWNITASGQTDVVTLLGNMKVSPVFSVTPTSAKTGGLSWRRWVAITNKLDISIEIPYDITDGGLDTATLVSGGKMQADGDDFLVWMNGGFRDRWLADMNTANTKCWINLPLSPRQEATTSVSIAGAGAITTITLADTRASQLFLDAMFRAKNKVVLIDSEAFVFTGVNLVELQLTGVTRARKDTAEAAHAAPATVKWVQNDIWILYGDSALGAPDVDDDFKPTIALTSDNALWAFTEYYDTLSERLGRWTPEVNASRSARSYTFTDDENTQVNPATVLGIAMLGSTSETAPIQETGQVDWIISHPAGITNVSYDGKRYRISGWPAVAGLQYLLTNTAWFTVENETAPIVPEVWEATSKSVSLGGAWTTVRFAMDGSLDIVANEQAMIQFENVELTIQSSNLPDVFLGAETAVNFLNFKLTNQASGEYIRVRAICKTNETLTIDCEEKDAYLSDGTPVLVIFSSYRDDWLDLLPPADAPSGNTLEFVDADTGNVTIVTSHRDMSL